MNVTLTVCELAELDSQKPGTGSDGGFQGLLVGLQTKVNRQTRQLALTHKDLLRIARYAFDYKRGGWQGRLTRIFGRTLGPNLGRQSVAA